MSAGLIYLIVLLPLFAAVIGGLGKAYLKDKGVMVITCGAVSLSAFFALFTFLEIALLDAPLIEGTLYTWFETANFSASFGVYVDKLTATMLLVVTSVSACVHFYSIGYMSHDESRARFFSYLCLFTFAMLALVTAPNLLQMFLGWEGVGLASYLLIGFWYRKESANAASMKAFVVNRIADAAMLLGLFTVVVVFGTLDYSGIFSQLTDKATVTFSFLGYETSAMNWIAFLLFIGAMGKSAQFGFHTWLPDAMEGPTPVSALIHAATMVTAGVFLLCRMSPVFESAADVLPLVAWVGAITALFAATIGLVQRDIKRVIAYSTCSQLGYMFFACGVGAYHAAMFHLTTHAFFKALLFLGAGSVIHAMHDEQDMFKMGALRYALPVTLALMWIGSLALAGIPPFAGFFSKDLILESAFMSGGERGHMIYLIGCVAALMTAFYSFRVLFLTFYGKPYDEMALRKAHESPMIMLVPMLVLAVGAVFSGVVLSGMGHLSWWQGAIVGVDVHDLGHVPALVKYLPLVLALAGIGLAVLLYIRHKAWSTRIAQEVDPLYTWLVNKWYIDELYDAVIVRPVRAVARFFWQTGDVNGIDRFGPNGVSWLTSSVSGALRLMQTGYIYHYAFALVIGICLMISFWLVF